MSRQKAAEAQPPVGKLKSERVQDPLRQAQVQDRIGIFISKMADCDGQRVRVDFTGTKVILQIQSSPSPGHLEELMEAALDLGQVA